MSIATHYILTNNTGALITLPNFQTVSPGLSAALSIHDYLLYCQYSQEFLQQVDDGDITVQYYTGDSVIVPKPATASRKPIQELFVPSDGRLAFTAPVSGVDPTGDNHLTTRQYVDFFVAPISGFGSNFAYTQSEGESSTSSTTYQQKLRMTTPSLTGAYYYIGWTYEYTGDGDPIHTQVDLNDGTQCGYHYSDSHEEYQRVSGFCIKYLSGVNTIDVDFRADNSRDTVYIRRVTIILWRVSN